MNFTQRVKDEIAQELPRNTCCRKAFSYGLIYNSDVSGDEICFPLSQSAASPSVLSEVKEILGAQFRREISDRTVNRLGRTDHILCFQSQKASQTLSQLSSAAQTLSEDVGFKCPSCSKSFLRGVFISCGNVTDPAKEYHLEFIIGDANKASKLYGLLTKSGITPKIANRRNGVGLYFKDSTSIEDMLTVIGATSSFFELTNAKILRDISNSENRATNCVASNISKSVNAAQSHINAIYKLMDGGVFELLPQELQDTAKLRLDNAEASLTELCGLHMPPISKSGLNHRLQKLLDEASKLDERVQNSHKTSK